MEAIIAERFSTPRLPKVESIRWRLLLGLCTSSAKRSNPTIAFIRSRKSSLAVTGLDPSSQRYSSTL